MNELRLTSGDLQWCYAASGCDNITGIRQVGFKTALSACRQHANVLSRLPRVTNLERTRIVVQLQQFLWRQRFRPRLPRVPQETQSLLHKFVFQMKVNESGVQVRKRLQKITRWQPPMDASINTYGLVVPPPPAPRFASSPAGHRDFNQQKRLEIMNVDHNKAVKCYNYWTTLENLESEPQQPQQPQEPEPQEPEPIEGSSRGTSRGTRKKKLRPPKPQAKAPQKRVQSAHTKNKQDLNQFHPMVTRKAPTIANITPIRGFSDWFQTHIRELKVLNY